MCSVLAKCLNSDSGVMANRSATERLVLQKAADCNDAMQRHTHLQKSLTKAEMCIKVWVRINEIDGKSVKVDEVEGISRVRC